MGPMFKAATVYATIKIELDARHDHILRAIMDMLRDGDKPREGVLSVEMEAQTGIIPWPKTETEAQ